MNNHRDLSGLVFNVLIVALVLIAIVVGLNRIGIYDLPDGIECVLGTYTETNDDEAVKGIGEHESITYDENNDVTVETTDVTYENAKLLLSSVEPCLDYTHEITVEYFAKDASSMKENISVTYDNGAYSASVYDGSGKLIKRISYGKDTVEIVKVDGENESSFSVPVGEFDISDECGFILTAESFTGSDYVLDDASFSMSHGEYGGELTVSFDSVLDGYTQKEVYTVSLDFGVVVAASCYENDSLVYSMTTKSLSRSL